MSFLKEPLLHFAVAGAVLFGAYAWLDAEQMADGTAIPVRITKGDVDWLRQTWSRQWLREPSADEMRGLVNELVNEQLLAREAQEMGLAEGDTIIRRRLAQKLKFLVDDTAQFAEPTEQELRAFHAADAARFATAPKLSFEQRYFNPEGREDAEADAARALAELSAGRETTLPPATGCFSATASSRSMKRLCHRCSGRISRATPSRSNRADGRDRFGPDTVCTSC